VRPSWGFTHRSRFSAITTTRGWSMGEPCPVDFPLPP
jgi:hypothetical protein